MKKAQQHWLDKRKATALTTQGLYKETQEGHTRDDNRPFPSSLVPLFQSESKCETILMKMTFICMKKKLHAELIFIWKVSHLDSLWKRGTRELGNGLLTYLWWRHYSQRHVTLRYAFPWFGLLCGSDDDSYIARPRPQNRWIRKANLKYGNCLLSQSQTSRK